LSSCELTRLGHLAKASLSALGGVPVDEITADDTDMIYAATSEEIQGRRKASGWSKPMSV
jgi:hypothetical protein